MFNDEFKEIKQRYDRQIEYIENLYNAGVREVEAYPKGLLTHKVLKVVYFSREEEPEVIANKFLEVYELYNSYNKLFIGVTITNKGEVVILEGYAFLKENAIKYIWDEFGAFIGEMLDLNPSIGSFSYVIGKDLCKKILNDEITLIEAKEEALNGFSHF